MFGTCLLLCVSVAYSGAYCIFFIKSISISLSILLNMCQVIFNISGYV